MNASAPRRRIVLVTGLSGAGKNAILRALEDMGYESIDNLPLALITSVAARDTHPLAVGIDARTRDFSVAGVVALLAELRGNPLLQPELLYATASVEALLRRYTESRRRHPMAPAGRVADGIATEIALLDGLSEAADLVIETSALPLSVLRAMMEQHFGADAMVAGLTVAVLSFAYPAGLPREADLVFDARFLRNPHYVPELRPLTGLARDVGAYIEQDPDFDGFFTRIADLLGLLLPRFVQEGKRYVTVAIGCTGGRHRSVYITELLAARLADAGWRVTSQHRELAPASPTMLASREPLSAPRDESAPPQPMLDTPPFHVSRAAPALAGLASAPPEA